MKFTNIQVLRLAAATAAVVAHLGYYGPVVLGAYPAAIRVPWVAGFVVPLFFVVSGFVLSQVAATAGPGRFLLGRAIRLYPGYWLAVLGAAALYRTGLLNEQHSSRAGTLDVTALTLWPPGARPTTYMLGVEWTLIYELALMVAMVGLGVAGARRRPAFAAAWLAVIVGRMVLWPGFALDPLPHLSRMAVSVLVAPFLLGVVLYRVKDRGRRWRWVVLALSVADAAAFPFLYVGGEWHWLHWGVWSAAVVWLAVNVPQLSPRNVLVRLGDCTYGLYLAHVPLMLLVLYQAEATGWHGRLVVLWVAGAVAIVGGLVFGRVELTLHERLRPLAKVRLKGVKAKWGRLRPHVVGPANRT